MTFRYVFRAHALLMTNTQIDVNVHDDDIHLIFIMGNPTRDRLKKSTGFLVKRG